MFGGAGGAPPGAGGGEAGASEEEALAAAKSMGMDLKEYQLAMRMRAEFAAKLEGTIAVGSAGDRGVEVTYDGNVRPVKCVVSREAMEGGEEALGQQIVEAMQQAMQKAQKSMQQEMQNMQRNIAKELG